MSNRCKQLRCKAGSENIIVDTEEPSWSDDLSTTRIRVRPVHKGILLSSMPIRQKTAHAYLKISGTEQ